LTVDWIRPASARWAGSTLVKNVKTKYFNKTAGKGQNTEIYLGSVWLS